MSHNITHKIAEAIWRFEQETAGTTPQLIVLGETEYPEYVLVVNTTHPCYLPKGTDAKKYANIPVSSVNLPSCVGLCMLHRPIPIFKPVRT